MSSFSLPFVVFPICSAVKKSTRLIIRHQNMSLTPPMASPLLATAYFRASFEPDQTISPPAVDACARTGNDYLF